MAQAFDARGGCSVVELTLVGVRIELPTQTPIVLLKERDGERFLPIWIGNVEATAIAFALQGVTTQRPLTHDLMKNLLDELVVSVERVVITDLVELRIIKRLLDAGVSLQRIREAIRYLRRAAAGKPLTDITLMSDGERIYACHSGEEVIDVLSHGQAVFGIAVGRVWADTEGELATMP